MKIFSRMISPEKFYDKIHKAQIQEAMDFERLNDGCGIEYYYNITIFPFKRYCSIHIENWFGMVESRRFFL